MDEKEFTTRLNSIQSLINTSNELENSIKLASNRVKTTIETSLKLNRERDDKFLEYLNLQKEYGFSNSLSTPSDLFPGIQTAMDMADPEKLIQTAEKMKQLAYEVTNSYRDSTREVNSAITSLKSCLNQLTEYMIQKNQVYDMCMELLQDADSIYDAGNLASNS